MDPESSWKSDLTLSDVPLLFKDSLKWKIISWNVEDWRRLFAEDRDAAYTFRRGPYRCSQTPIWERSCDYEKLNVDKFFERFSTEDLAYDDWMYFDYKHISSLSPNICSKLDISWEAVGYPEKTAKDSTIWIGTRGAHTPCHIDSYGCNFTAQIFGRKRWILFPPHETTNLSPVRVPYEESSIYSSFNFFRGCAQYPDVKEAVIVDLEPGCVLYVPKGWWHYVENLTSGISANVWIPKESDKESRISECLVKFLARSILMDVDNSEAHQLLNPNEDDLSVTSSSRILGELKWCLDHVDSPPPSSADVKQPVLTKHSLPFSSIQTIKKAQHTAHKCDITNCQRPVSSIRANLLNSLCHPVVIEAATKQLLAFNSFNKMSSGYLGVYSFICCVARSV